MKEKNLIETKNFSPDELKKELGSVAILEGSPSIDKDGYLPNLEKIVDTQLELLDVYYNHEQLIQLKTHNIETLLVETTFAYQDKIYDIAAVLFSLYYKTGWKPKRVVNTMKYGLSGFYAMCNILGIEVYRIRRSLDNSSNLGDYELQKVFFSEEDLEDKMELQQYSWFNVLHEDFKNKREKN